eukprot:TRINITY_DN66818_c9_g1_i1.p1 TRINITY_DN66818_c9_g1~~TRINITY_DN66818_c9_g1_i1.p1  ORF type:complete len:443 (-),score=73.52 TRINITY_DN66818_c9_g1_i1:336-1550(-)
MDVSINPNEDPDLFFCYNKLKQVSRSFAAVIIQLNGEVRDAICIFYLVLRGLDTVEDDMAFPEDKKIAELRQFYKHLDEPGWCMEGVGYEHEKHLLEHFHHVISVYHRLPQYLQEPIADICHRMGDGMADFISLEDVETTDQYELYCHYVAGLVGHGLTSLFAASGLENSHIADDMTAANSMGLFLQKTNIIRDYLEDIVEVPPRMFWPKDIWGNFTDDFHSFKHGNNSEAAVGCLNAMITDALKHIPDCLQYLEQLHEPSVFMFCAIPQVMAIASLTELYNNPKVFTGVVKIRKGQACQILLSCTDLVNVRKLFHKFCVELRQKLSPTDPSYEKTKQILVDVTAQNLSVLEREGVDMNDTSITRKLITRYEAVGGAFLYSVVDSLSSFWRATPEEEEEEEEEQ